MSQHTHLQEEEINIGGFFQQIGKFFTKLFEGFLRLVQWLYHIVIVLFIFIKNHFIKLAIGALIGVVLGFFAHKQTPKAYLHQMVVIPNYESAYFIQNKINYYNQLIFERKFSTLATLFSIDIDDASSIMEFTFKGVKDEKDLIVSYDELVKESDTTTIKELPLKTYLKPDFAPFPYKKYYVNMFTSKPDLKKNIHRALLQDWENNPYLQQQKTMMMNVLHQKDSSYYAILKLVDSVLVQDKKIAYEAAKNGVLGSRDVNISSNDKRNKDVELLETYRNVAYDRAMFNKELPRYSELYQVISPMESVGKFKISIFKTMFFKVFSLVMLFTLGLLLFKPFLNYLNTYRNI